MTKPRDLSIGANIGPDTAAATSKTTPVDADLIPLSDSAATNTLKSLSWANLKARIVATFGAITQTGITMNTSKLLGRTTASAGVIEEISIGSNLTLSAGTLSAATQSAFPTGTQVLFAQAAAPTGWTQITTHNDKILRVVSGTGYGSGGSTAFSTFNAQSSVGATTLTSAQSGVGSHGHTFRGTVNGYQNAYLSSSTYMLLPGSSMCNPHNASTWTSAPQVLDNTAMILSNSASASASHTHSISTSIQYVDIIICSKN